MPKQLKRLAGPAAVPLIASSEVSVCTPASGTQAVLRHIQATNNDTSTHYLCISIGTDVQANRIVDQVAIPANGEYARFVTHVVGATEIVCAGADAANKIAITINGDLYTLG